MIDLETLAERRAKELEQVEAEWVEALRQPSFDEFSSYLSDGEIEEFVFSFRSTVPLTVVSGLFLKALREGVSAPYSDFTEMMGGSSLKLGQGFDFIYQLNVWEKDRGRNLSFNAKLDALKNYLADNSRHQDQMNFDLWVKA
jgi:hypothetical protein